MFDILISGGTIIDGTGRPGYQSDLGITGDRIAFIGKATSDMVSQSKRVINASGMAISPGFVDCHTHSDLSLLTVPQAQARLYGGVTTDIAGNCGLGVAPISETYRQDLERYFLSMYPIQNDLERPVFSWNSFGEYLDCLEKYPSAVNMGSLVAQGAIRIAQMGFRKGKASDQDLRKMQQLVTEAMEAGAFGISSGLNYLPGAFCEQEELIEVVKPVSPYGGMYISHIRTQSDGIFDSLDEAFHIAESAGVGMHISHLKLLGASVWKKTDELFQKIDLAKKSGLPVSFDAYPYDAGATGLIALLPHWTQEGGVPALLERLSDPMIRRQIQRECISGLPGWQNLIQSVGFQNITISDLGNKRNKDCIGKNLEQIAAMRHQSNFEALFDLILEEKGQASMVVSHMCPEDVDAIITHPDCMIASDSASFAFGKPHPRFYGTNGRIFSYYVRQKHLLTLEEAVRKMTSLPARQFRIRDRGALKEGYYADVLVFDPQTIGDLATYDHPTQYSVGIRTVIVNGQFAMDHGEITGTFAGHVVRPACTAGAALHHA